MKNTMFYNVMIVVGVLMFISAPYLFLKSDSSWILLYASIELFLSIIAIIIGIIGNIKLMKKN